MLDIIVKLNKLLSAKSIQGDLKTMDNKFYVKVLAKLSKTLATKELQKQLKQLNNLYVQVGANVKIDRDAKNKLQKNIQMLQSQIADLEIGLKASKTHQAKINSEITGIRKRLQSKINSEPLEFNMELKKSKLIADIEYLGKRYSKLFSNTSANKKYESIMQNAISVSDKGQLADTRTELAAFTSELKANGLASKSTGDKWRNLVDRSKDLFSAATAVRVVFSQMRQAISSTLELDTAMTDLYKVQNDVTSREQFSGILTKWNKLAQELSVTTESLISSASEWSKIGFDLDMSEQLAQITAIFEKTAEISNEQASKTLISGAQAFTEIDDLGEEDYVKRVEAIGNKINAIGNKYAISSEGISEALQNSSAALKMANNDLDESIALITAGNKIFQSPEEMGNTLKVVSARLRGQKGELEALNEDTEGMIEGVSKVQTQILNLTKNKVNIFESDNETLKSTYDIMLEVGKVLDSLSDKDSASLLEIMFGKQRMSAGSSLLLNYEELEKVKNDSMNAANSMAEEYAKYMESAEAHITTFKEKLVETYQSFMNGDTIKYAADFGTAMLNVLNKTDLLRHGLLAIASIKLGQGISTIGLSIADAAKQMNTLGGAIQKVNSLSSDNTLRKTVLKEIGDATKGLTDKNLKLLLSQKQLLDNDKVQILLRHNLTEEEAEAKLIKMGLISATNAQTTANTANTTSTFTLSGALTALKASAIGAGQAIKAAFLSNPIGFTLMGITTAFSILSTFISGHNQKLEEANQKAKESAEASAEQSNKLSTLLIQYNELSNAVKSNQGSKEDLLSVQSELLEALGVEEAQLQRLVEKYGDLDTAINQVTLDALQKAKGDLLVNVDIAREELLEAGHKSKIFNDDLYIGNNYSDIVEKMKSLSVEGLDIRYGGNADELVYLKTLGDASTEEGIMANYNAMMQLRQELERLYAAEGKTEELGSLDFYKALNSEIKDLSDSYENYDSAIKKYNDNVGMTQILTSLSGKEIPKSKEEFEIFQEQLIQTALASGKFIGSQEDIKDSVINALAEMPEFAQYFEEYKESLKEDTEPSIFDTITQLNTQLKPALDSLKSAYQDIFKQEDGNIKFSLENVDFSMFNSIKSAIGEMNQIEGIKIDYSSFENLLNVLSDADSESGEVQTAFDRLANEIVYATDCTNMSADTFDVLVRSLESMGLTNAEEVLSGIAQAQGEIASLGYDLANITEEQAKQFIEEGKASAIAVEYLRTYLIQKQLANHPLNTANDVIALENLCNSLGVTGELLKAVISLKSALGAVESGAPIEAFQSQIDAANAKIAELAANGSSFEFDFNGNSGTSSASKAGKEAGDAYLDAFEEELSDLKKLRDDGFIGEKQYLDRLRVLYQRYFKDKAQYAKEYAQYEREYLDGMKSLYESIFSHASKLVGKQIDLTNEEKDARISAMEETKKAAEEAYEAQQKIIDDKIKALEAEKKVIEDTNAERDRQINLQEKLYKVKQLDNQLTISQYSADKGMSYVKDYDALKDAREEVNDAKDEIAIANIEKQIDALEEERDRIDELIESSNEYWDAQIEQTEQYYDTILKGLEEYQAKWDELSDMQEHAEMIGLLKELGYTEEDLLNQGSGAFDAFRNSYLNVLADLNMGNQGVLDALGQIANVDMSSLPGYLAETQGYIDSISNMDVSSLTTGFDNIASSASNAASAISGTGGSSTGGTTAPNEEGASANSGGTGESLKDSFSSAEKAGLEAVASVSKAIEGDGEENGGIIGAVDKVIAKIGTGEDEEDSASLASTLKLQTEAALDEESGIPAQQTAWDEMNESLGTTVENVTTLKDTLEEMDGKEFTITLNIEGNGTPYISKFLSGSGGNENPPEGGSSLAEGTAHAEGTANARGIWASRDEGDSLVGELGQEMIVRDGRFFTVGDNGAEFVKIKKGDIVFNHLQTKELLKNGHLSSPSGSGNALYDGTVPVLYADKPIIFDQEIRKRNEMMDSVGSGIVNKAYVNNALKEQTQELKNSMTRIASASSAQNAAPTIHMGTNHFICNGVTGEEVLHQIEESFNGLSIRAYQRAMRH